MKRTVSGIRAKNSFMLGVADGFIGKIKNETPCDEKTMIKTERNLQVHVLKVYPKMRGRKVKGSTYDLKARSLGQTYGKNFIHYSRTNKQK